MQDLQEQVKVFLADRLSIPREALTDETPVANLDSLEMLDLTFELEKQFGVDVMAKDGGKRWEFADFRTVGDVCAAVARSWTPQNA